MINNTISIAPRLSIMIIISGLDIVSPVCKFCLKNVGSLTLKVSEGMHIPFIITSPFPQTCSSVKSSESVTWDFFVLII